MKIALCNIPIHWEQFDENLILSETVLKSVFNNNSGVELLLLPEFFTYGFSVDNKHAESINGNSLKWLKYSSSFYGSAIYASVPVKDGLNFYNRGYFVRPDGTCEVYDKRHLFSYGGEDKIFTPGSRRVIVNYHGWKILLQICYDLRFPVWSRNVNLEYDLIINIASWPSKRANVINPLVRSRAIENQSFYAFLNRSGSDPYSDYNGESLIIKPDGSSLESIQENNKDYYSIYSLNIDELLSYRSKFQFWRDSDNFKII